jgi:multiple sugar transport system permease protein
MLWTFEFTILAVSIELILGMIFAIMLNSTILGRARDFMRGVFLVPIMFSGVVTGWMWRLMFDSSYGPVNHFLSLWGIDKIPWGATLLTGRSMILITDIWFATPFVMLILLAGLQNIPIDLLEAASIDGASNWQKFTRIVLPLLKFPIMVVVVIRTMDGLRIFDLIRVLTRGGPGVSTSTIMLYTYQYAFSYFQIGRAAAMSFAFMVLIFFITYLYVRLLRREAAY